MSRYTVLWIEDGKDRWDRVDADDLYDFLLENDIIQDEDTMIYGPENDYQTAPQMLENGFFSF